MGQIEWIPVDTRLGHVLQDWKKIEQDLKKKKLLRLCNHVWLQYKLESQEKWALNRSLNYNTILQLDLYCKRESKWSEILHVQVFMTLYLGTVTGRNLILCVTQKAHLRKQSEDSLADPVYRAMWRPDPHSCSTAPQEELLCQQKFPDLRELLLQLRLKSQGKVYAKVRRGQHHISELLLCTSSYPRNTISAQLAPIVA